MTRSPSLLAILIAVPLLAPAGEVQVFPAKGVDISRFKTFQMLPTRVLTGSGVLENDPEVSPFINSALRKELTQKGLTEVSDGADLEVSAGALVVSIPQVEAVIYSFYNLLPGDTSWGSSPVSTIGRYNREGTLIVNLIDPAAKKSVWLGFAKRALGKPSNRKKDINKAARDLFKKYPEPK